MSIHVKHPWHGVETGALAPKVVRAVIEIQKGSKAKYELDKDSGLLKLDRILFSAVHYPANYGFIPQTYCDDKDPLDILVISSMEFQPLSLVDAKVIGVMRMVDNGEQDDKIIAVAIYDPSVNHSDSTFLDGLLIGSAITEGESFYNAAAVQSREMHPTSYSLRLGNPIQSEIVEQPSIQTNFIKIFPNPANNTIKVATLDADDKIIRIELYSSLGNLITAKSCNTTLFELDIQSYIEGLYKLRAFTKNGFSDTKTFSIVR